MHLAFLLFINFEYSFRLRRAQPLLTMFKIREKKVLSELVLERYRVLTTFKDVPTPVYHNLILIFLILI